MSFYKKNQFETKISIILITIKLILNNLKIKLDNNIKNKFILNKSQFKNIYISKGYIKSK